ncbi:hypothetical protein GCM10009850_114870 [Nonomuraea monospora]|uniref:Uncharacterized protein n=1 Tax=Nonomuraea monospora TaxID=568818 RepID=A0ABN3D2X4_9ACTN
MSIAESPAIVDEVLAEAGVTKVLAGIRMPRVISIMERRVQSCRREFSTAASYGTNAIFGTPCGSMNVATTDTAPIKPSTKRLHCVPSRI